MLLPEWTALLASLIRETPIKEAIGEFSKAELLQSAPGPISDEFVKLKEAEWSDYHGQVSQWEIDRYLTLF